MGFHCSCTGSQTSNVSRRKPDCERAAAIAPSLLQVIKIIANGPLVGAGHLVLAERALSIALCGRGQLIKLHFAQSFDTQTAQRNAWHWAARIDLTFNPGRQQTVGTRAVATIGKA